jgi:hypothetical protein
MCAAQGAANLASAVAAAAGDTNAATEASKSLHGGGGWLHLGHIGPRDDVGGSKLMISRIAAAVLLLPVGGCTGLIAADAATAAIGGGLMVANRVASDVDATIQKACAEYEKGRVIADAVAMTGLLTADIAGKISVIEEYSDAACANPPSGDALSTAIAA